MENDKYQINLGFGRNFFGYFYNERLIEWPFIFRHIDKPPKKVLDIGCWESILSIQLAMLGYKVTGIDIQNYGYKHKD
jgi:2-polyprenyl-3-methyl-5-hydroxy-6-metoxy-1,4-benzoquinol methylase